MSENFNFGVNIILGLKKEVSALTNTNKEVKGIFESFTGVKVQTNEIANNIRGIESDIAKSLKIDVNDLTHAFKNANLIIKENGQIFDKQKLTYLTTAQAVKKLENNTRKFNKESLAMLFAGMFLMRTFGAMNRAMFNTYKELTDENDLFMKKVFNLGGAFSYLKFQIFDAFANNPFVNWFTDKLTEFLVKLGDWFSDNPTLATSLIALAGALTAVGGAMIVIGQVQMMTNVGLIAKLLKALPTKKAIETAVAKQTGFSFVNNAFTKTLNFAIGLGLAAFSAIELVKSVKAGEYGKAIGYGVAGALGAAGAIVGIFNPALGILLTMTGVITFVVTKFWGEITESASRGMVKFIDLIKDNWNKPWSKGFNYDASKRETEYATSVLIEQYKDMYDQVDLAQKQLQMAQNEQNRRSIAENLKTYEKELETIRKKGSGLSKEFNNEINLWKQYRDEIQIIIPDVYEPVEGLFDPIEEYKQQIDDLNLAQIFQTIDLKHFEAFKQLTEDTKPPVLDLTKALASEGLIGTLLELEKCYINHVDIIIPKMNTAMNNEIKVVDALTNAYKRLNREKSGGSSSGRSSMFSTLR